MGCNPTKPITARDVRAAMAVDPDAGRAAFLRAARDVTEFHEALQLRRMRIAALRDGQWPSPPAPLTVAFLGACTLSPLCELASFFASVFADVDVRPWCGDFDNYVAEALDGDGGLVAARPELVVVLPSEQRCRYDGDLAAPVEQQAELGDRTADEILTLCGAIHAKVSAQLVVANFKLPGWHDPGPLRATSLVSDYAYRRHVNTQLGQNAPSFVHICDVEFLANRIGTLEATDLRGWFESKQPYSPALLVQVAKEIGHIVASLRRPAKKVIVVDLDNTLWGGVIGDDGLEGIELGTTSPRGEAFRFFQEYLLSLSKRGVLLAVCSKNDLVNATDPFAKHPEMVLRLADIAVFKANWEPKADNIREIAKELNLGLDSFVFVDDNPAEIEIVRQFVPEVTGIWLGDDPAAFVPILADSRLFEARSLTSEDLGRVRRYAQEADRQALLGRATDMQSYLESLEMVAEIAAFSRLDAPRIAQLINKSNQFNLTTRRRTESEVIDLIDSDSYDAFTVRLSDRFGEHGLIAVVIAEAAGCDYVIDTWLMSCRVLNRQVEEETLNEIVRAARARGCARVVGKYIPTAKNGLVADLFDRLGFSCVAHDEGGDSYALGLDGWAPRPTSIRIGERING